MNNSKKFYVVTVGRTPGIYSTWAECQQQTNGFPSAKFKSYATFEEATDAFEQSNSNLISTLAERRIWGFILC